MGNASEANGWCLGCRGSVGGLCPSVLGELTPHPIEIKAVGGEFLLRVRDPGTGSRTGADGD